MRSVRWFIDRFRGYFNLAAYSEFDIVVLNHIAMVRLPEEITKGKAVTYKLVKLKKVISYYDSKIRATQKFSHAISICDIPFIYLFESKAKDGRRGLYFSTAAGVGQNIQYNAWWIDSRSEKSDIVKAWIDSDFPAVNYGIEVKQGFGATMFTDDKRWPNAFWKKAFGAFTMTVEDFDDDSRMMTFGDVFLLSCQCYTTLVVDNKCLYSIMENWMESRYSAVSALVNHSILTPRIGDGIQVNVMKRLNVGNSLNQGEHITHTRGTMADMKAWVHLINTLSLNEYDDTTYGIVNMDMFDTELSLKEYYNSLTPTQKTNFVKGKPTKIAAWLKMNQNDYDEDWLNLWVGYMLSPANTLCDGDKGYGWGGFSTADESKRRYGDMED